MFSFDTSIRVRYAHTDQMGCVYYGNYPSFYEIGRVEMLRALGHNYKDMKASGIMMPVLESHSKYILPARYDELLTIRTTISKIPLVKMQFTYQIFNQSKQLIHEGETILVFINQKSNKPCRAPQSIIVSLKRAFEIATSK